MGNDLLRGGGGVDSLYGGFDNDILHGDGGDDVLLGEEGNDQLNGGGGKDMLDGGAGDDVLRGQGGDDILDGGLGLDHLYGGGGRDTFVAADNDAVDIIHNFQSRLDKIAIIASAYGGQTENYALTLEIDGGITYVRYDADGAGEIESVRVIGIQGGKINVNTDIEFD